MLEMKKMAKFFDNEAELGSDDEEHDDVRKNIDKDGDEEENEDGLDDDLDGFVVHKGDDEEIGEETEAMHLKFQRDMEQIDRELIQKTMAAVLLGNNNKKRKRNEVEGLGETGDGNRRKMRLIEERMKQMRE